MPIFDTFDRTGIAEFPFPRDVVFKAVRQAAMSIKGMKISESSPTAGFLNIKTGVSAMSWGETVKVSVISSGPWLAQVQVTSAGKTIVGSVTTHSKNQKNLSALIHATGAVLDRNGNTWAKEMGLSMSAHHETTPTAPISKADELKKLAELRNEGILTEAEFLEQKTHILNS